jgi:hypothetical protein
MAGQPKLVLSALMAAVLGTAAVPLVETTPRLPPLPPPPPLSPSKPSRDLYHAPGYSPPMDIHSRESCSDEQCRFHGPMLRKLQRRAARSR